MLELQKIGAELIKLPAAHLGKIELPENLSSAIQHAKSLTSNEAKRRQLQYIGKIMREVDVEPIKKALEYLQAGHKKQTEQFHKTEEWRDKLLSRGDQELNSFLAEYPDVDRQQLRQLVRKAQQDKKSDKNTGAETALFKLLRTIVQE